ncbi:MAG: MaoC family dehydratase [Pseudomonadota bacterium]
MPDIPVTEIPGWVGKETGVSDWILVDQARINQFADVTEDWQFIHVDPEAAKETPFGGTVAHGFLTLSLLARMAKDAMLVPIGIKMGLNYGFEKVRFMAPVAAGKRVRGAFTLKDAQERPNGQWRFVYVAKVEIEDEEKPALIAEWVNMMFV